MKRKPPAVENAKSPAPLRKRRASSRNGHANGNGNGNGNGDNNAAAEKEVFDGQPAIETLLAGAGGRRRSPELDKAKLLGALAAIDRCLDIGGDHFPPAEGQSPLNNKGEAHHGSGEQEDHENTAGSEKFEHRL